MAAPLPSWRASKVQTLLCFPSSWLTLISLHTTPTWFCCDSETARDPVCALQLKCSANAKPCLPSLQLKGHAAEDWPQSHTQNWAEEKNRALWVIPNSSPVHWNAAESLTTLLIYIQPIAGIHLCLVPQAQYQNAALQVINNNLKKLLFTL